MKFLILKNDEKYTECKTKLDLYEKWEVIYQGLAQNGNHDWSTGFMMKSRTNDKYSVIKSSSKHKYNMYDQDEFNLMRKTVSMIAKESL